MEKSMKESMKEWIARFREKDLEKQSVSEHILSVAAFCRCWGKQIGIAHLAELAGLVHDMGKYSDDFQKMILQEYESARSGAAPKDRRPKQNVDHGVYGALYIHLHFHTQGERIVLYTAELLSMAVCYHHGGLEDYINQEGKQPLIDRMLRHRRDEAYCQAKERYFSEICTEAYLQSLFDEACKEVAAFLEKLNEAPGYAVPHKCFAMHLLLKYLYSVLIDADRCNAAQFEAGTLTQHQEPGPTQISGQTPAQREAALSCPPWEVWLQRLEERLQMFQSQRAGSLLAQQIRGLRAEISDRCREFAEQAEGIYKLSVPTGSGKTLASLRFALRHAALKKKKRILYVLPFQTIIEQNAEEVRKVLDCGEALLEHHANVLMDKEQEQEGGSSYWERYRILTQRWDAPIIFTTMVQFLNTFYAAGTQSMRRLHNLSDTVFVFDEIQAIPLKCIDLFNCVINFLSRICGGTVILCTATQPELNLAHVAPIFGAQSEMIPEVSCYFQKFKRVGVVDRTKPKLSIPEFCDFTDEIRAHHTSLLIVMNTKACANAVYNALRERCRLGKGEPVHIYYLSTNLCPRHRIRVLHKIKKNLAAKRPLICISTQLIEAGVDISFSCVIRQLAGLPSIAQAAGRSNRSGENPVENAFVYIVDLVEERLNNLPEIARGSEATMTLLARFREHPAHYDCDLLSPAAIREYYQIYYAKTDSKYRIRGLQDMYGLLSDNGTAVAARNGRFGTGFSQEVSQEERSFCRLLLPFMCRTAAENFHVIDEDNTPVLVPYGRGKKIIAQYISAAALQERQALLRAMQQYVVQINSSALKRLEIETRDGVHILKEGYYHQVLGVVTEKYLDPVFG